MRGHDGYASRYHLVSWTMQALEVYSVQQLLDCLSDANPNAWVLPLSQRAFVGGSSNHTAGG